MNLVEIMGLKFGTTYTEDNIKALRYVCFTLKNAAEIGNKRISLPMF